MYEVEDGLFNYSTKDINTLIKNFSIRSYNFLIIYLITKVNNSTDPIEKFKYQKQLDELKKNKVQK